MKVCLMGLTGYRLLKGEGRRLVVGPDVYQVLLAEELAAGGIDVSYINYDEGGPPVEKIGGVKFIKIYPVRNSLNVVQKYRAITGAMAEAGADIYFQQGGAGPVTPLWCRLHGKKSVISIGHDAYVDKKMRQAAGIAFRLKTSIEIRLADALLVLSQSQGKMLKEGFGRDSTVLGIHTHLPPAGWPHKSDPPVVLWVGTIYPRKQPHLFLELARAIPQARFQMVGGHTDEKYVSQIRKQAVEIPNLDFVGFVPYERINEYFRNASIFVGTSQSEGFPNVFIQAWMNYTPVVSLNIDPDGVIKKHGLGFHSGSFEKLVGDVKRLLGDETLRRTMAENARRYAEENNDIKVLAKRHIEVFERLLSSPKKLL